MNKVAKKFLEQVVQDTEGVYIRDHKIKAAELLAKYDVDLSPPRNIGLRGGISPD